MDDGFGRGQRTAENLGDFFVAHFVLSAQQNRGALVFRQFGQSLLDFLGEFAVQNILRGQKNFFCPRIGATAGRRVRDGFPRVIRRDGASGGGFR